VLGRPRRRPERLDVSSRTFSTRKAALTGGKALSLIWGIAGGTPDDAIAIAGASIKGVTVVLEGTGIHLRTGLGRVFAILAL
jgi:hypothetical protein